MCLTSRQANYVPKVGVLDLQGKVRGWTSSIALPYTYRRVDGGRVHCNVGFRCANGATCQLSLEMLY